MLRENPDTMKANDLYLSFRDEEAFPFAFWKGKAWVGDPTRTHHNIAKDLFDRGAISAKEYDEFPKGRSDMKYTGRLWMDEQIISFWDYPTKNQMKSYISKLEKAIGKRIWNAGWQLEIIDKGGKIYRPKKSEQGAWGWDEDMIHAEVKLIPIEEYQGSKKQVGKEISHNVSPMLKKSKKIPMGMGSRKKVKGARPGEVPAATKFRIRKGLGDGIVKLKDLIKEILLYEDQSDELVKIARTQNGLVDPKGKVYAVPSLEHVDWIVANVSKFKEYKKRLAQADANDWSLLYEAIMKEIMSDGWMRISGNRKELGFMGTKKTLMRQKRLIDDIIMFAESVTKHPMKVYRSEYMIR